MFLWHVASRKGLSHQRLLLTFVVNTSLSSVNHTICSQNTYAWASGLWTFKHRNLWDIGVLPPKRFQRHGVFLHGYCCHNFSPKAPRSQSCDLLLAFRKSHCNQQVFQGNNVDGSFCLPSRQKFQPSSASTLAQPHHLQGCWSKSKGFHHNQVDHVTTRAQARFTPGIIPANFFLRPDPISWNLNVADALVFSPQLSCN